MYIFIVYFRKTTFYTLYICQNIQHKLYDANGCEQSDTLYKELNSSLSPVTLLIGDQQWMSIHLPIFKKQFTTLFSQQHHCRPLIPIHISENRSTIDLKHCLVFYSASGCYQPACWELVPIHVIFIKLKQNCPWSRIAAVQQSIRCSCFAIQNIMKSIQYSSSPS